MRYLLPTIVFSAIFSFTAVAANAQAQTLDPSNLQLASANALVVDTRTGELVYSKNASDVTPIASITKLMTAMVVIDANQALDDDIEITDDDVDTLRHSHSRLPVGTRLTRAELLHLALMSSDNRAAHALGRNYPGGIPSVVSAMNERAKVLGMRKTRFVEPTGLSDSNVSTAKDLAQMVKAASQYSLIQHYTTNTEHYVEMDSGHVVEFHNTNALTKNDNWDIRVSKTGYIREAGRCLVMMAKIASRDVAIVLLDAFGSRARTADAMRVKYWMETGKTLAVSYPKAKSNRAHKSRVKAKAKNKRVNYKKPARR